MANGKVMQYLARTVFVISATMLFLCAIVLLWLRPSKAPTGLYYAVIGINAVTMAASAVVLRIAVRREKEEPMNCEVLNVLECEKEGTNDSNET